MNTKLRIDKELRAFCPPLTDAERDALERALIATGRATDPIVVWRGTILDGHNRFELCSKHGFPFDVIDLGDALSDREAAKRWMFDHQIARRNLSRDQIMALAALRGVAMPAALQNTTATDLIAMAADEAQRPRVERVLCGEFSAVIAVNLRKREGGQTIATRRSRVDVALDAARDLSDKDFETYLTRVVALAKERRG